MNVHKLKVVSSVLFFGSKIMPLTFLVILQETMLFNALPSELGAQSWGAPQICLLQTDILQIDTQLCDFALASCLFTLFLFLVIGFVSRISWIYKVGTKISFAIGIMSYMVTFLLWLILGIMLTSSGLDANQNDIPNGNWRTALIALSWFECVIHMGAFITDIAFYTYTDVQPQPQPRSQQPVPLLPVSQPGNRVSVFVDTTPEVDA